MMKKLLTVFLSLLLIAGLLSACGNTSDGEDAGTPTGQKTAGDPAGSLKIVATIFPVYDWVRNILGDQADDVSLTLLMDSGADLHNYNPDPNDIMTISESSLFIFVGGESDEWAEEVLAQHPSGSRLDLDLMEALGDMRKEEEHKEGMAEEEHEEDEEEGVEYDEHIWLSLKNAAFLCGVISEKLQQVDPANAETYQANAAAYIEKLNALDAEYQAAADGAAVKTIVVADRFPFRYLVSDYGLDYFAAYSGCSAETEVNFDTVPILAGKVDALGLRYVFQLEGSDGRIARTVVDATQAKDQTILTLNSLQSVTAADVESGADYLSLMRSNLDVLKTALG